MDRLTEPLPECHELRPAILAVLEDEADGAERQRVAAHLAICAACRAWRDSERRLDALLLPPAPRRAGIGWRWPVGLAATLAVAITAFAVITAPSRAYGSLAPTWFGPSLRLANGGVRQPSPSW